MSIERFIALLIEHYNGQFPLWLTPTQAIIIPIAQSHGDYAFIVEKLLNDEGMRILVDDGKDRLNAKIRNAQMKKINYILIVGDKEIANDSISVRSRKKGDIGSMSVPEFLDLTGEERNTGIARAIFS